MATQEERRTETRARLLEAAAELFAARGIEGSSIDAIADGAGRTSGAVYDHFGGKEGLLFALLEDWVGDVSVVIDAELAAATTLDERLATVWRNVVGPPPERAAWITLEHELWSYATRHDVARAHLARRYRAAAGGIDTAAAEWLDEPEGRVETGAVVIALLFGLEMMRRIDPEAVTDAHALAALRSVVVGMSAGAPAKEESTR